MSTEAARTVVDLWVNGMTEVLNTALEQQFTSETAESAAVNAETVAEYLGDHPIVLRATLNPGDAIAMLLTEPLAVGIARLAGADDLAEEGPMDEGGFAVMNELADVILGAGAAELTIVCGQDIEVEGAQAERVSGDNAEELLTPLGGAPQAARFTFGNGSGLSGEVIFLYTVMLEDMVKAGASGEEHVSGDELVSNEEMKDILSGFGTDEAEATEASTADPLHRGNLDVIMGIELTATARLGRIEMPISEVLSLGPGSIIEVGQFVDEPIELLVNNRLVARGDVVVVDEKFGLRITEIVSPKERVENLR